jgi:large repetitive protein
MRTTRWLFVSMICSLFVLHFACSGDDGNNNMGGTQCSDGQDNNGDGAKDFPGDPSCTSADDETEDGLISPQCNDEKDNDGDGKHDFPNDPGCFAPQQDSEEDDCPDGPGCPQCSNNKDDDANGVTDFPSDTGGCMAASDTDEYTQNPIACGTGVQIKKLPFTGTAQGMLMAGAQSHLTGMCGGTGTEDVYEIRVLVPKVIVATTNNDLTMADTVLYLRSADCVNMSEEVLCNDNIDAVDKQSTLTASISTPGTYYLIVDSKDSIGGMYDLSVKYYIGEGTMCLAPDECGPGLVCRVKKGDTGKTCAKHICEDGLDEDGDGKNDFPQDPGCATLIDDDEADTCASGAGPGCPECGDMADNDGDGKIDFAGTIPDTTCSSASSASEACVSTDGVATLTMASTMDTTVGAIDDVKPPPPPPPQTATCGLATGTAPDKTYRLDLPAMQTLSITNTQTWDGAVALYNSLCVAPAIACHDEPEGVTVANLAAGAYYYVVDGYSTGSGAFTINVSGTIVNGGACDSPLAMAGAITCGLGYACTGTTTKTCTPAACFDGLDSEPVGSKDSKIDYPDDPGCDSPADNDEANPATAPKCSDGIDNDVPTDGLVDYPADFGCASASGTTEAFCVGETDPGAKITTKTTTGTTVGKVDNSANFKNSCSISTSIAPDVSYALNLPVPVATMQFDTNGSTFDTTLAVRTLDCATELACKDQGGSTTNASLVTMTGMAPGGYAIVIDGWSSTSGPGAFTLNVQGTVAQGTVCNSPLFTGGTAAVLLCPAGTTCKGTPTPKCLP